jgi:hypothetical protein
MDMAGNDRTRREDGVGVLSTHLPTVLARKRLWQRAIIVTVGWFAGRTCKNPNKRYTNRLNYCVIFGVHTYILGGYPLLKKLHRTVRSETKYKNGTSMCTK